MSGWRSARARYRLVHEIAAGFARGDSDALAQRKSDVEAEFGDAGQFLRDVQRRYRMAVEARLDAVTESGDQDLSTQVSAVLEEVAEDHPGLLRILLQHEGDPALADGSARLRALVRDFGGQVDESGVA